MERTFWRKQTTEAPLFPDLIWGRPENRHMAGKLLIIGGNAHGFAAPAEAYQHSLKAGAGSVKVILPDAVKKFIGSFLETAEFAPSTPSGSFARTSLAEFMDLSSWADGTLIAGDLGRNSETAIVLEEFLKKSRAAITITKDAVDYFALTPQVLLDRENTLVVASLAQVQKLCQNAGFPTPITFSMGLLQLVDALHQLTSEHPAHLIIKHHDTIYVASGGDVSTTKLAEDKEIWRVETAAKTAVWWLQNPSKPFEALTTAITSS